ncbi:DUF3126 family protein [Radicibacter daui]|jgi:hypothetical protein|uniref:DUF3126 family protein n=1 Tax=Radicibacter daui TaxID=3064829 RepID=UPI004046DE3E
MTAAERLRVQKYLQQKFRNPDIEVRPGEGKDAPAQLYVNTEFMGVLYRDEDEGEITYDLNISILDADLPQVKPV